MVAINDSKKSEMDIHLNGTESVEQSMKEFDRSTAAVMTDLNKRFPDGPPPQKPSAVAAGQEVLDVQAVGVPATKETAKDRKLSGGEIFFDRAVYTGLGFGVNEGASLWITDQFKHGKPKAWLGGKPFSKEGYEAATQWISKNFKMTHAKAGNSLLMATLLSGGTLLVLPMRMLEENKIFFTEKANHLLDQLGGCKLSPDEVAARDAEVRQAIACSPQQTWSALLVGRAAAMLSSWATGTFLIKESGNNAISDFSQKHLTTAANALGMKKISATDTFKRYARLAGIETYSCAISAGVLEIVSKMFAKRGTEVHDPEICKETHPAPTAPTDTNSEPTDTKRRADQFKKAPIVSKELVIPASYAEKIQSQKDTSEASLAV